jgi:hypothetical protein
VYRRILGVLALFATALVAPSGTFSAWTSLGGQVWHGNPDGNPNDLTQARPQTR